MTKTKTITIGQKIKQRRKQLGLEPLALSKKIGITPQRIWELENTSTRPSAEVLFKVADALDTPMFHFLTDCELNEIHEEVLLVKFRKLNNSNKKLTIEIIKLLKT